MYLRILAFLGALLCSNAHSFESVFSNDREGKSFYSKSYKTRSYNKFKNIIDVKRVEEAFEDAVREIAGPICGSSLISDFHSRIEEISHINAYIYLREINYIDDIIFTRFLDLDKLNSIVDLKNVSFDRDVNNPLSSFLKRTQQKDFCVEDFFSNFISEIRDDGKKINSKKISKKIKQLSQEINLSSEATLFILDLFNKGFYGANLTLRSYINSKNTLRDQYPINSTSDYSDFVTLALTKKNHSLREELYKKYSYMQIILMGKIITDLRAHLESNRIEILVYERSTEEVYQTITLDPMERFRFSLAHLRKTMNELWDNSFFNGAAPNYSEVITAAFELGIISAGEWEEIRSLEDIWNPKVTLWDKASLWAKVLMPVAGVFIPPPFGFTATLGLVAIDMVNMNLKGDQDFTHSLFK